MELAKAHALGHKSSKGKLNLNEEKVKKFFLMNGEKSVCVMAGLTC